ncbi:baseplate J/gp47 family protein [Brevinema andersonii]|uniref:baseplate J/gp47 family protein n=1 Tax=Brevinema andersonii TaxID=34097 RepID=UPI00135640BC|nr:baseplate J/gp47 family protein [Brevinema andersonii]
METVAAFIFHIYESLNHLLPNLFTHSASGNWLDQHAEQVGLHRIQSQSAEGYVIFSRTDTTGNLTISKDKVVATKPNTQGKVLRYRVKDSIVLKDGQTNMKVWVVAENPGSSYNVGAGQITEMLTPISGIDAVTNASDWLETIGLDRESDNSLRERCLAQWQGLSGANAAAYIAWAKQVPGIEHVLPIATARGLGTVDVVITGTGNTQPSETVISEVQKIIDAHKPIGTDVLVKAPEEIFINPIVSITADPHSFVDTEEVKGIITAFFNNMPIGKDFEPSELVATVFQSKNIKAATVVRPGTINIANIQIARKGILEVEVINE